MTLSFGVANFFLLSAMVYHRSTELTPKPTDIKIEPFPGFKEAQVHPGNSGELQKGLYQKLLTRHPERSTELTSKAFFRLSWQAGFQDHSTLYIGSRNKFGMTRFASILTFYTASLEYSQ